MKAQLLGAALFMAATRLIAANYVGDQTFTAPFNASDTVNITGNLTLATPGVYAATSWNVLGNVRFAAAGSYTFTATSGGMAIAGNVLGPATGAVTVHISYRTNFSFLGNVANNVSAIDDSANNVPPPTPGANSSAPLVNLSTRATLGAGQVLNAGFVIGGNTARRVLVRGIGPTLTAFGVTDAMANPMLLVTAASGAVGGSNDDWSGASTLSAVFTGVGAFALANNSRDAAVVLTLEPGTYTAQVRGSGATDAGEVLVEVYFID